MSIYNLPEEGGVGGVLILPHMANIFEPQTVFDYEKDTADI